MKKFFKAIVPRFSYLYFIALGFRSAWENISRLGSFREEFNTFKKTGEQSTQRFSLKWNDRAPYLTDNTSETPFDYHYIYHPAWAARIVAKINPPFHIDISSRLDFSTILSAFIPVRFYDYRPAPLSLSGLDSKKGDLNNLPFEDKSVHCISCMHTVEHVGLGRYGDVIDYDGDIKAINELMRVTAPGGSIIFVTPVGQPKIIFNGHRIYAYEQIIQYFSDCTLTEFSLVDDKGNFITNADASVAAKQVYGCGCFWFIKK